MIVRTSSDTHISNNTASFRNLVMSLAPSPSVSRGGITVQPSYFTSSLYIHPLREDILHLIQVYSNHYVQTQPTQPFSLFKTIWNSIGWTWMHFKVFDSRARDMFLKVTMRLFLGKLSIFCLLRSECKTDGAHGQNVWYTQSIH
jgi:hypothetical protein